MPARIAFAALAAALLATVSAVAQVEPQLPEAEQVSCSGVYGPDSSEALVIETFGAENVVTGPVPGPEGTEFIATTVFPDDTDRKMEFAWFDQDNLTHLSYVDFSRGYILPGGLRIGMTAAEVQAINGEPFNIGGFWWDYGGYGQLTSDTLNEMEGGCYLSVRFAPADEIAADIDTTPVSGEVLVPSDDPLLERIDTRVQVLGFGYAWPDDLEPPDY